MEVVAAVVGSIMSCVCNSINTSLAGQYMKSTKGEIEILRTKKVELIAHVNDLNERLRVAEEELGKTRTSEVQDWLTKASNVVVKVDSMEHQAIISKRCLNGVLPNCCSRMKLDKLIFKLDREVTSLLEKAGRFSEESIAFMVPEIGLKIATAKLVGESTPKKNFELVWECLMGDKFHNIGVYGMGGVGKTTMMTNINNRLVEVQTSFNKVIWVTVSKDVNVKQLQSDIAKVINLDLSTEQDETRRASFLLRALDRRGKLVLILDDIWEAFSLHEIGIPEPSKDNGCKLLLSSRSSNVCQMMGCDKIVKIELLSEDEAWQLFIKTVGVDISPDVVKVAKIMSEECARLPLAIVTIGGAMRGNDDIREWRVALNDLRESSKRNMSMDALVIERLKFSYSRLKEEVLKECFLYCALYPEDCQIDPEDLINYWIMEGLIEGTSKEYELDRGYLILNKLEHCCMLEYFHGDDPSEDYVKMHDLIRDMALHITRTDPRFMVRAGGKLGKMHFEDDFSKDLKRASFMNNEIEDISISPGCPELLTLMLCNNPLKYIAPNFFVHMKVLTVLDISSTEIECLPESISDLKNLRALLLSWCENLRKVPSLSKVQSLRVLKLDGTGIEELPDGMEMLVNLKCLDLKSAIRLRETIPRGILLKLPLLQELGTSGKGRDFVEELLSMKNIDILHVQFYDLSNFFTYITDGNFKELKEFFFTVGTSMLDLTSYKRGVSIGNSYSVPYDAMALPKTTQYLSVENFHDITRLIEFACIKDVNDLRECIIYACDAMECILSSEDDEEEVSIILKRLEVLNIQSCDRLCTIYKGVPTRSPFPCLKRLDVCRSFKMKSLLSTWWLQHLQNLEEINVSHCDEMEELIIEENEETGEGRSSNSSLPRLRKLNLMDLPKLKSIWKGD
ncbi:hypothetical protein AQUCO_07800020v1, partial [Aquilegia coerulea]